MVITGPNGSGKSTLLNNLRHAPGTPGPILYVGPHRNSRRQTVRARNLYQSPIQMSQLLAGSSLPNIEGIEIRNRNRDAWDYDEASSYLKYSLCQIETDRQTAITERYDKDGQILKDVMPDVWTPLKEMTSNLLPHLQFFKIDGVNRDQIQCYFHVHAKDVKVDIDDLSSGEKSVIQLFFPLLENRIHKLLDEIRGKAGTESTGEVCVLMDEPELHLHPVLQGKVLEYIRAVSIKEKVQFILATHSPTIVENANSDELYLLRPSEYIQGEENQLVKIATDDERLSLMREVFGSTSNITAMRPILIVEGRKESKDSRSASDSRIYSFLSEKFNQLTIIPGGGKNECKTLAGSLTDLLRTFSKDLTAYALLDRDLEVSDPENSSYHYLPVSMIENLLVDPAILWDAVVTVRHKTDFQSMESLEKALDAILGDMEAEETTRRIKNKIGGITFRAKEPIEDMEKHINEHVEKIRKLAGPEEIEASKKTIALEIEKIKTLKKRREYFHGKDILTEFYKRHLQNTGMSKEIFIYQCAKQASARKSVKEFSETLFNKIEIGIKKPEKEPEAKTATN